MNKSFDESTSSQPGNERAVIKQILAVASVFAFATCGCYNDHPSDELTYVCDPDNDACGPTARCVLAGTRYVCSANDGCPGGCAEYEACIGETCKCFKNCEGMECGLDPLCGISCGTCQSGEWCNSGVCQDHCADLECGDLPHVGINCGECDSGWWCDAGTCKDDCAGLECGLSPYLGVSCGTCQSGQGCKSGDCVKTGDMALIPAGTFMMGCNVAVDTQCSDDEKPYHEVTLSAYYIDKTEVTVAAYKECVDAGTCTPPDMDVYCNWNVSGKEDHPVNCIDWNQSKTYCEWAGKRLPTEAQWEKAARGTDGRKYPWGNESATCDYAVMYEVAPGCGTRSTMSVCSKSPTGNSPYELCDTSGNVWEWVSDWYDSDYYTNSPTSNPTGPDSGSYRIRRGGSLVIAGVDNLRASSRNIDVPFGSGYYDLGFRCARND